MTISKVFGSEGEVKEVRVKEVDKPTEEEEGEEESELGDKE